MKVRLVFHSFPQCTAARLTPSNPAHALCLTETTVIDGNAQILFCRTFISGRKKEFRIWILNLHSGLLIKSPRKVSTRHLRYKTPIWWQNQLLSSRMKLFLVTRITFESIRDDILNCWKELGETLVIIRGTGTEAGEMEPGDSDWPYTSCRGNGIFLIPKHRFLLLFANTKPQSQLVAVPLV